MALRTYGPGVVLDPVTMRGVPSAIATVVDLSTGDLVDTFNLVDAVNPQLVVTNRYGYFGQFRAATVTDQLQMTFGEVVLNVYPSDGAGGGGGGGMSLAQIDAEVDAHVGAPVGSGFLPSLAPPASPAHGQLWMDANPAPSFVAGNVGSVADAAVAAVVPGATSTGAAIDARTTTLGDGRWVVKGARDLWLNDYAAVDVSADQSTGVQSCFDAAAAAGAVVSGKGSFALTAGVTLIAPAALDNVTLTYTGTGEALNVGGTAVTSRQSFRLPKVVCGNTGAWDGASVGIRLNNLNACDLLIPYVKDFENGIIFYGKGTGIVYNTVRLGQLSQNHKTLTLTSDATGWANQNTFLGGRFDVVAAKGATSGDVNAAMLVLQQNGTTSGPNDNTFVGTSFEGGDYFQYRWILDNARYNTFENCRYEVTTATFPVLARNASVSNRVVGGYDAAKVIPTLADTSTFGEIQDTVGGYMSALHSTGQVIPTGVFTTLTGWSSVTTSRVSLDATTGRFTPALPGRWFVSGRVSFAPNATGRRRANLKTSTGAIIDFAEVPGNAQRNTIKLAGGYKFAPGESFYIEVDQNSGADLALETTANYNGIRAERLAL